MNCPYCNGNLGPNSATKFCPVCGHKLIRCATCGDIIYKKMKFCPKDGTPIPEELLRELPDDGMNRGAQNAAAMKQGPSGRSGSQYQSSRQRGNQYRSNQQPGPQSRPTGQGATPYRPTNTSTPPHRPANPGPAPGRPVNPGPSGGPGNKSGLKKGLLAGLIALLLIVLGIGGYYVADKLLNDSTEKTNTESNENEKDDDQDVEERETKNKKGDDEETSDDSGRKEKDADDKEDDSEDSQDAASYNGDDNKNSDTSDKEDKADTDTGISFTPEKTKPSEITASVNLANSSLYSGMTKAKVSSCSASSVIQDNPTVDCNDATQMVDGKSDTSWQEGVSGDGIGEWTQFILKKEYNVRYLTFKMGNWRDQERYNKNNRPKGICLKMGGQTYNLTFPDGKNEYMVELSDSLPVSDIYVEITSVYKGSEWDDTCISEMTVYAE